MGEISTKRLPEIDIIKATSLMLIILHHEGSFLYNEHLGIFYPYLGRFGLALFTFISGYALYKNNAQISSIKTFYKKRLLRIYPLYLLALFSYVAISNFHLWKEFTPVSLAAHILGLQMLIYPYVQPDGSLWYIGMLFIFYAVYPFLIEKSGTPKKLIWNAGAVLVSLTFLRVFFGLIEIRTFVYFPIFIAGMLAAWTGIPEKLKTSAPIVLVPLIFIRLNWITEDGTDPINHNIMPVVLSLSLMLLFFCFVFYVGLKIFNSIQEFLQW
jgi:peptidoglycan/LPS O-acetylase OafA/YrhL